MMRMSALIPFVALASCGASAPSAPAPDSVSGGKADAAHPAVVELFQSQGCSSCPPAVAVLNSMGDRPDVLPLLFAVTYWDDLGWKDQFGDKAYTDRQWDYARRQGRPNVATPQAIVNGRVAVLGSRRAELDQAIAATVRTGGPEIMRTGDTVTIGAAKGNATVWLVRYDPRTLDVPIRAGENSGRTIAHRDVVRSLTALGNWKGAKASFAIPAGNPLYKSAILVQSGKGGPIVAAARI